MKKTHLESLSVQQLLEQGLEEIKNGHNDPRFALGIQKIKAALSIDQKDKVDNIFENVRLVSITSHSKYGMGYLNKIAIEAEVTLLTPEGAVKRRVLFTLPPTKENVDFVENHYKKKPIKNVRTQANSKGLSS